MTRAVTERDLRMNVVAIALPGILAHFAFAPRADAPAP